MVADILKLIRTPVQAGACVLFAAVLAFTLWPLLSQFRTPETAAIMTGIQWSAITGIVTPQAEVGTTSKKGLMRIAGTILGGFSGLVGAELARAMPTVAPLWVTVFSVGGAMGWKIVGQMVSYEYAGQIAAIATLLISWKGYTNPNISVPLLFVTRIGGICFGAMMAQFSALLIFPAVASTKVQERMVSIVKLLKDQTELIWEAFLRDGQEVDANISDRFYTLREQAHNELRQIRDLLPKAALERYVGKSCGGDCWVPRGCACHRGSTLDKQAALDLITNLRAANRLVSTLFGVAYGDGTARPEVVQVLHQQYRHAEDGGISALRKLRIDTLETWQRIDKSLAKSAPVQESHKIHDIVEAMLRQSKDDQRAALAQVTEQVEASPGKWSLATGATGASTPGLQLLQDESYFQYRWYTFLILYYDLSNLMDKIQSATTKWVASVPNAKKAKAGKEAEKEKEKEVAAEEAVIILKPAQEMKDDGVSDPLTQPLLSVP